MPLLASGRRARAFKARASLPFCHRADSPSNYRAHSSRLGAWKLSSSLFSHGLEVNRDTSLLPCFHLVSSEVLLLHFFCEMMKAKKRPNVGLIFGLLLSLAGCCCLPYTAATSECQRQDNKNEAYSCKFRTLKNLNDSNFDFKNAREVNIECLDTDQESILKTNHLGYLPHLKKLSIENCLIKKVPALAFSGLSGLHALNFVNNGGQNDEATIILEMEADAFTGLNDLRSLNFSGNNMWSLPKGIFCSLSSLTDLDLSRNFIQDTSDLGFSSSHLNSCRIPLRNLDLSHNSLSR